MKKEKVEKIEKKPKNKIYAMDILPSKSTLKDLEDYVLKIPKQFECSFTKGKNNDILLEITIGEVSHIIRCNDMCVIMGYIEGVMTTYYELGGKD